MADTLNRRQIAARNLAVIQRLATWLAPRVPANTVSLIGLAYGLGAGMAAKGPIRRFGSTPGEFNAATGPLPTREVPTISPRGQFRLMGCAPCPFRDSSHQP